MVVESRGVNLLSNIGVAIPLKHDFASVYRGAKLMNVLQPRAHVLQSPLILMSADSEHVTLSCVSCNAATWV